MKSVQFDELTRALAGGTSKRQALKSFLGTALGLGLLGPSMSLTEAASPTTASRADIARTSAQLLSRLPDAATLQRSSAPGALKAAVEQDRRLLAAGTRAHTWSDSQLLDFQNQVSASVAQHQAIIAQVSPDLPVGTQVCFNNCANQFTTGVATCGTGLGGLLCEVLLVVGFDLCALGCILGGLGLV